MKLFWVIISTISFSCFAQLYDDKDIHAAKYLSELERKISKNNIDTRFITTVKNAINESSTFKRYSSSIEVIENISKGRITDCSKLEKNESFFGANSIFKSIRNFCHNKNLSNLYSSAKVESNDASVRQTISFFLKNNPSRLTDYLLTKKAQDQVLAKILFTITEFSLEEDIIVPQRLLEYIDLNSKITKIYQRKVPLSTKNKIIITKEFSNLSKQISTSLDKIQASKKLIKFHLTNQKFIFPKTAWKSIVIAAQNLRDSDNLGASELLFNYSIDVGYDFETRNDSIFYSLWLKIFQKKYPEALKVISDKKLIEQFPKLSSRVKFWIAYSLYNEADYSISNHLFSQLIKSNPLNYYAIISQNFIPNATQLIKDKVFNPLKNIPTLNIDDFNTNQMYNFKELLVWGQLNYTSKTDDLLDYFANSSTSSLLKDRSKFSSYSDDEVSGAVYNFFLKNFNEGKSFLTSFKFMSRLIDKDEFNIKCININNLFPTDYISLVNKVSGDIDPLLILSIIRQESAFNKNAKSSVGATGLMQLMPETARSIAKKKFHPRDLEDPLKNITFGTNYFGKLLERFDGDIILALSSYNAGPTKVSRWKRDFLANLEPFFMIEEIPYKETRLYVKLIYRNFYYYQMILNKAAPTGKHSFKIVESTIR